MAGRPYQASLSLSLQSQSLTLQARRVLKRPTTQAISRAWWLRLPLLLLCSLVLHPAGPGRARAYGEGVALTSPTWRQLFLPIAAARGVQGLYIMCIPGATWRQDIFGLGNYNATHYWRWVAKCEARVPLACCGD